MFRRFLLAAAVLALSAPAGGALAQQWGYGDQHAQDHEEHGGFHDEADEAHAQAHDQGFYSRREHRAYHRALRDMHHEFHDEHPGTRHDGYRLPSRRGGYDDYGRHGYAPYGYNYGPRW